MIQAYLGIKGESPDSGAAEPDARSPEVADADPHAQTTGQVSQDALASFIRNFEMAGGSVG
jgi:hypothetical protein